MNIPCGAFCFPYSQFMFVFLCGHVLWNTQSVLSRTLCVFLFLCVCQCGVWETLLTALEILIRVHHPHQVFNIRQFLKAEVVHRFLLTCQVLQVRHRRCRRDLPQPSTTTRPHHHHCTVKPTVVCLAGAPGRAPDRHPAGGLPVLCQDHPGGPRLSPRPGATEADLQLPAGRSPAHQHLCVPHANQFLLLAAHKWVWRRRQFKEGQLLNSDIWSFDRSLPSVFFFFLFLSDGKLYQEKVQSIMYLRHSGSGGKSTSSSVMSLSPTVFTEAQHEGANVQPNCFSPFSDLFILSRFQVKIIPFFTPFAFI